MPVPVLVKAEEPPRRRVGTYKFPSHDAVTWIAAVARAAPPNAIVCGFITSRCCWLAAYTVKCSAFSLSPLCSFETDAPTRAAGHHAQLGTNEKINRHKK